MAGPGYQAGKTADEIREGNIDALIEGVLTDEKAIANALLACEQAGLDEDDPLRQRLERSENTHTVRKARKQGHVASLNAAAGISDTRIDATGYERIVSRLSNDAAITIFKGGMGTGKTGTLAESLRLMVGDGRVDTAYLNFPLKGMSIEDLQKAERLGGLGNTHPWQDPEQNDIAGALYPEIRFSEKISDFLEFAKTPGEKVGAIDEFSTVGNFHVNHGEAQDVMAKTINAFRKSSGGSFRLWAVGHDKDNDIVTTVRDNANVVVSKDGKASEGKADLATVYDGFEEFVKDEDSFSVRGIRDVPKDSPWRYDTNYFAHLEWNLDNPAKQIRRGKLVKNWEEFQDDDADDPGNSGEGQQYVSCRGEPVDGGECGATVTHVSGFCYQHRDQWDGDTDPRIEGDGSGDGGDSE